MAFPQVVALLITKLPEVWVPVSAIEAEILKCVLDGGIPARCLPQEVVKSVETWVPGRRQLLELIGKFH